MMIFVGSKFGTQLMTGCAYLTLPLPLSHPDTVASCDDFTCDTSANRSWLLCAHDK